MIELTLDNLLIGDKVQDSDFMIGTVVSIENIHNVYISYGQKGELGNGLYCLDKNCPEYDPLFKFNK